MKSNAHGFYTLNQRIYFLSEIFSHP